MKTASPSQLCALLKELGYAKFEPVIKLSDYDVVKGIVKNERGRQIKEIGHELNEHTRKLLKIMFERNLIDEDAQGHFDGWTDVMAWNKDNQPFPVSYQWITCFSVPGGSEGDYVHVEVIDRNSHRELMFLEKTFGGMEHGLMLANIATVLFNGFQ